MYSLKTSAVPFIALPREFLAAWILSIASLDPLIDAVTPSPALANSLEALYIRSAPAFIRFIESPVAPLNEAMLPWRERLISKDW